MLFAYTHHHRDDKGSTCSQMNTQRLLKTVLINISRLERVILGDRTLTSKSHTAWCLAPTYTHFLNQNRSCWRFSLLHVIHSKAMTSVLQQKALSLKQDASLHLAAPDFIPMTKSEQFCFLQFLSNNTYIYNNYNNNTS